TMITIEGTVMEILGYPSGFWISEDRSPAVRAPRKAATAGGQDRRSTSSSRSVLAIIPIQAAEAARGIGLLNIMENPKTPQKLAASLRKNSRTGESASEGNSSGCRFKRRAMAQAVTVATTMIITA